MNILEAEDMVKGLPDQVLFQYAQNPPPQIPQYLAVSEVQRRQEMRQRFQAQSQGQQPTVKDQILQGGSPEQAPQGGPPGGAPPGAAPPGAPMEQPMTGAPMGGMFRGGMTRMANGGLTPGGIVYMQEGRTVPNFLSAINSKLEEYSNANRARTAGLRPQDPNAVIAQAKDLVRQGRTQEAVGLLSQEGIDPSVLQAAPPAPPAPPAAQIPSPGPSRRGAVEPPSITPVGIAASAPAAPAAAPAAAPGPVDFMAEQRQPPMNFSLPANFGMPSAASVSQPQAAPQAAPPAPPASNVAPGGIGDLAPRQQTGGIPSYLANLLKPQERSPEVQAAIDLNRQMAEQGLPAPVDLSQYVKSAQQRQQEAQTEARRMAIANTLMGLGTGLVAGDPAAGLQRATQMATQTLAEGRKEAQAEGRMAEQLQLQQAQQQRQAVLDAMKFRSESVNSIANLVSGEEKANRNDKLQAAQIVATYNAALDRNRAELESQGRLDERSLRTARTAALQAAREIYLANPANVTGKTNDEIARELSDMARMLDPDSFGSSDSTTATPSGKSRFTITEVRTGR